MKTVISNGTANETRYSHFSAFNESKRIRWSNYRNYGY